jgi:hypothetical protein
VPLIEDMRTYGLRWLTGVDDADDACAPAADDAELAHRASDRAPAVAAA